MELHIGTPGDKREGGEGNLPKQAGAARGDYCGCTPGLAASRTRVLILGDAILDEHIWADVARISPEAPVPVADVRRTTRVAGGAGNVATNVRGLDADCQLIAVIGDDEGGNLLLSELTACGIDMSGVQRDPSRPTTTKTRIIARGQHLVRIDRETRAPVAGELEKALVSQALECMDKADVVVLSDYGKGVLTPALCRAVISHARTLRKPVLVDPKGSDYSKYCGATLLTPNRHETEIAAGLPIADEETLLVAAERLRAVTRFEWLVVTRGEEGLSLFDSSLRHTRLPAVAASVYDVTGAGDTVVAVLAVLVGQHVPMEQAAAAANVAAAVVIQKPGTVAITKWELDRALERRGGSAAACKRRSREQLQEIARQARLSGRRVVFTNGCFDLLHVGHVRYLEAARRLGDILIVGVNSDASVNRLKGTRRPIIGEEERAEVLGGLESVDYICTFEEDTPTSLLQCIQPDVHVKGGDYSPDELPEATMVLQQGGEVRVVPYTAGHSTRGLIEQIVARYDDKLIGG